MARILFGMVGERTRPIGGVKVIYQAVTALRNAGIDAHVATTVQPPEWLAGGPALANVSMLDTNRPLQVAPEDMFVALEYLGGNRLPFILRNPERRVMFIQNHNLQSRADMDFARVRHVRCLTVSEFSRERLREYPGFEDISVVYPGVDPAVFKPARRKRHRIAYMPRKRPGLAEALRARTRGRIEWLAIDGRTEAETARLLGQSSIFLNLGRREGFGLPPVEAMASGCVVCGFAGEGTTDYATEDNGFWAAEDDTEGCLRALAAAIDCFSDAARVRALREAGRAVAERYALSVFEREIVAYFSRLL